MAAIMKICQIVLLLVLGTACSPSEAPSTPPSAVATSAGAVVLYEGATLIDGETGAARPDAAFVVEGGRFGPVGRKGEVALAAGGTRVDLTGKTVMPALVSAHVHIGLLDGADFGPEVYTREKIVEHLERYAFYGIGAVLTAGTDEGPLSFEIRASSPAGAARLLTSGRGVASPDGGPGFPAIARLSYPVTTADEGRERVRELAARRADAVKIWVDDRGGRVKKLTPDLFRPVIDEAHAQGLKAVAHVYYLDDAHALVDAGIDGFMHPVRDQVMDDELIRKMKERNVFLAANIGLQRRGTLSTLPDATRALLAETVPASVIEQYEAALAKRQPEALATARATYRRMSESLKRLSAAGVRVVLGGDTGIPNAWHGWAEMYELETMVDAGLTPAQAIVASTSASAAVLGLNDMGAVAPGKRADFVVLDASPLENISNAQRISAVYLGGQAMNRASRRARWTR
jgi:imidazolonepropionase-like amidohydrolase